MKIKSPYKTLIIAAIIVVPIAVFCGIQPFSRRINPMWLGILLDVSIPLIIIFAGIAILRKSGLVNAEDLAPGWQIRCMKCGFTESYGKYGVRIGAVVGERYTVGWCSHCHGLHRFVIEKVTETPAKTTQ